MDVLDNKFDERSECLSILVRMNLTEYKKIAHQSFVDGGNISGQRDVIKRSSVASKIRKRMIDDFNKGAIFPSVVIGLLLSDDEFLSLRNGATSFNDTMILQNNVSIIDGMQRSNIYFTNFAGNEDREIRAEFWISNKSIKLLYRMLVLNTGQVPWNTRRQVEVIFGNLSDTIIDSIYTKYSDLKDQVEILSIDDNKRRTQAGRYQRSTMIEMYLGYNTRTVKVDVSDELADEFQRFDMMGAIEQDISFNLFVDAFAYLCKLDIAFSTLPDSANNGQFEEGRDIFGSVPACLGFIVACSEYVMGKISIERDDDKKNENNARLGKQVQEIISISQGNPDFLALVSLNEAVVQIPKKRIGEETRLAFKRSFYELLKYDEIEEISSLEAFWRQ